MKKLLSFLAVIIVLSGTSYANTNPQDVVQRLLSYSDAKKPEQAKEYMTERSHSLFDRLYAHDLTHLIPSDTQLVDVKEKDGFQYARFADPQKPKQGTAILVFQQENSILKLDLPETFRTGFGEDWPKKIDMIEASYLFTKQYYGEAQSKKILEAFLGKKSSN